MDCTHMLQQDSNSSRANRTVMAAVVALSLLQHCLDTLSCNMHHLLLHVTRLVVLELVLRP